MGNKALLNIYGYNLHNYYRVVVIDLLSNMDGNNRWKSCRNLGHIGHIVEGL